MDLNPRTSAPSALSSTTVANVKAHLTKNNQKETFCRWESERRSEKGDCEGSSKASKAKVLSSSSRTRGSSSPRSANCSEANFRASSTRPSRISSMSCCCWKGMGSALVELSKAPHFYKGWTKILRLVSSKEKENGKSAKQLTFFNCVVPNIAPIRAQPMALLGLFLPTTLSRGLTRQMTRVMTWFEPKSVSRVAPDWDL